MDEPTKTPPVPCGLYRTSQPLGTKLPAGRLVYYHNHGDPGPGLYPVEAWRSNKAVFAQTGILVYDHHYPETLVPLPAEGFYKVRERFSCCAQGCETFQPGDLVQLGYDGAGRPILFRPSWSEAGVQLPSGGTQIEDDRLEQLEPLRVPFEPAHAAPAETAPAAAPGPTRWDDEGPGPDDLIH